MNIISKWYFRWRLLSQLKTVRMGLMSFEGVLSQCKRNAFSPEHTIIYSIRFTVTIWNGDYHEYVWFYDNGQTNLKSTWILVESESINSSWIIFCFSSFLLGTSEKRLGNHWKKDTRLNYTLPLHIFVSLRLSCAVLPVFFPWAIDRGTPGVFCVESPHHAVWSSINNFNIS